MATETPRERLTRITTTVKQMVEDLEELNGDLTDFNYELDGTARGEKIDNCAEAIYEFAYDLGEAIEALKLQKHGIDKEFNDSVEYDL